jgi:hypothetical protein
LGILLGAVSRKMHIETILLAIAILVSLWIWIAKPIRSEARRQLRAEIADLRNQVRRCNEELTEPGLAGDARKTMEDRREGCRRRLAYLESRLHH